MQKPVLGKGLSALIPQGLDNFSEEQVTRVPIDEICLNPMQPRRKVEEEKIRELAESISKVGLLQPIIITRKDGLYHLVVGERRLRAAKSLGMERIPAVIKEYAWDEMLKIALVENLQREDLNAIEEARAYQMLLKEHNLTQEQVAESIGKSRPYVANVVRLLNLPPEVMDDLENDHLTPGHARALLGLEDHRQILLAAARIKKENLSVRQAEELVRRMKEGMGGSRSRFKELPPVFQRVQESLRKRLSARVNIVRGRGQKGKIEIHFSSGEELERLVTALGADENWENGG